MIELNCIDDLLQKMFFSQLRKPHSIRLLAYAKARGGPPKELGQELSDNGVVRTAAGLSMQLALGMGSSCGSCFRLATS